MRHQLSGFGVWGASPGELIRHKQRALIPDTRLMVFAGALDGARQLPLNL